MPYSSPSPASSSLQDVSPAAVRLSSNAIDMAAPPFANTYHRRAVAPSASKPCYVCYKPTPTVLNQADSKDFFYICPGHLTDRGFATPLTDPTAEAAKAKKEALEKEIEVVKKQWEEKQKKKKKGKDKSKKEEKDKGKKIKDDDEPAAEEEEKDPVEKLKELEGRKTEQEKMGEDGPRMFELQKSVFQMRVQRLRGREQARAVQERMRGLGPLPSVPRGEV